MSATPVPRSLPYLPEIDSLRFVAVVVVMLHHYLPEQHFPIFGHGVVLFFFLSGYFSTRQLLKAKGGIEAGQVPLFRGVRAFHLRRYLRIFPVYYAVVLAGVAANLPGAREAWPWLGTFSTNWYILRQNEWIGPYSPFWSLALLEQFYLFWPTLFLALPRRAEIPVAVLLVLSAPVWRLYCAAASLESFHWFVVPVAGFDQLGAGAMLAILQARRATLAPLLHGLSRAGLFVCGPLLVTIVLPATAGFWPAPYVYQNTIEVVFFVWLVDRISAGVGGFAGRCLKIPPILALGRASYSIFALHNFTIYLIPPVVQGWMTPILSNGWRTVVLMPLTFLVAWLSYRYLETPVNRLKRFFPI